VTPAGGESGGHRAGRLRGGRAGPSPRKAYALRAEVTSRSYQPVRDSIVWLGGNPHLIYAAAPDTSAESASTSVPAFFDPGAAINSMPGTLAFRPPLCRYRLICTSGPIQLRICAASVQAGRGRPGPAERARSRLSQPGHGAAGRRSPAGSRRCRCRPAARMAEPARPSPRAEACKLAEQSRSRIGHATGFTTGRIRRTKV
jgi:hypothetical protein